jgi:hypothetical protein
VTPLFPGFCDALKGALSMHQLTNAQHEAIEKLAYRLWEERGAPSGSPDDDWFRAEHELRQRSHWLSHPPFSSMTAEPAED